MKTFTQIATKVAFILTLLIMYGCSSDDPVLKTDYGKLRIGRMDLSGAVSIGLKGNGHSSRAIDGEFLSAGLYKVDASGNISAVGVYFTTDTLGNRLEHEEVLRIVPTQLFDLTDNYMLVVRCSYYDCDGDLVSGKYYTDENGEAHFIKQDVPYKDLLVRKSDGKIWCVDNIAERLYKNYSYNDPYDLIGNFNEDSRGNLYFRSNVGTVYKFNLNEASSSFEQVTANILMFEDFFILDNGVVWSYRNDIYSQDFKCGWPHSGHQTIDDDDILDYIPGGLERNIPGGTFDFYYGQRYVDHITMKLNSSPDVIFACYNNQPLVIVHSRPALSYYSESGSQIRESTLFTKDQETQLDKSIRESKWPVGLLYDIEIGDKPGSAKLKDNPIELLNLPDASYLDGWWGTDFSSIYVGDGYILTSGRRKWITKIDLKKREWVWLKQLNFSFNFSSALWLDGRIWSINSIRENFGAYWFDPVTFEDGFVKFSVEIPPFIDVPNSYNIDKYINANKGIITLTGVNPATGDRTTLVINITTGDSVSDTQAPQMLFETLINLN